MQSIDVSLSNFIIYCFIEISDSEAIIIINFR